MSSGAWTISAADAAGLYPELAVFGYEWEWWWAGGVVDGTLIGQRCQNGYLELLYIVDAQDAALTRQNPQCELISHTGGALASVLHQARAVS